MYSDAQWVNDEQGNLVLIRVDINGVTSFVPLDPANTDYQNIMKLVEEGQLVIQPAD
jgi:hypothetical protein